jgi:SAM-dependent methyltransferase
VFDGRLDQAPLPWDERAMVRARLASAEALLDLGTGGGERLSALAPLPRDTVATEGYPPNLPVARERLEPLGVTVVPIEGDDLPFDDGRFDLVVARHESFDPVEVARVLRPGGTFITQQVGGRDLAELNDALGSEPHAYAGWDLASALGEVAAAGLEVVTAEEGFPPATFHDIGAIVLFCRITPWQVPGFSVDRDGPALRRLHHHLEETGAFTAHAHRFVIEAVRPA